MNRTIVTTSVITFFATSALWIAGIALLIFYFMDSPNFSVTVESPNEVNREEIFTISIDVTNPSDETITLGSIDIYDSLLEGFEIVKIEPNPEETDTIFDFHTTYFNQSLAPRGNFRVAYTLKAKAEGLWIGDIDCCTPSEKFVTTSKAIRVN